MMNVYVDERLAQLHAAALDRELDHQQRVQVALASRRGSNTETNEWYGRAMRWLTGRLPAWPNPLDPVQGAERSQTVAEEQR